MFRADKGFRALWVRPAFREQLAYKALSEFREHKGQLELVLRVP